MNIRLVPMVATVLAIAVLKLAAAASISSISPVQGVRRSPGPRCTRLRSSRVGGDFATCVTGGSINAPQYPRSRHIRSRRQVSGR